MIAMMITLVIYKKVGLILGTTEVDVSEDDAFFNRFHSFVFSI